jgi:hypothetical protein
MTHHRTRTSTRAAAVVLAAVTVAAATMWLAPAIADRLGEEHLPNLRTRSPLGLRITHESGATLLRFTNTVANVGQGPLELRPVNDGETTTAYQRIFTHDTDMDWVFMREQEVGAFVFHPQHNHWHFEGFAEYQLHEVALDGGVGGVLREALDKVSFCVADSLIVNRKLKHFDKSAVGVYPTACSQDAIQGISVGWADRYGWRLYGQWIDITGLPDGTYWLTSGADPLDLIEETNDGDNRHDVKIRIEGDTVTRL